jgi:hypothetical protein
MLCGALLLLTHGRRTLNYVMNVCFEIKRGKPFIQKKIAERQREDGNPAYWPRVGDCGCSVGHAGGVGGLVWLDRLVGHWV